MTHRQHEIKIIVTRFLNLNDQGPLCHFAFYPYAICHLAICHLPCCQLPCTNLPANHGACSTAQFFKQSTEKRAPLHPCNASKLVNLWNTATSPDLLRVLNHGLVQAWGGAKVRQAYKLN